MFESVRADTRAMADASNYLRNTVGEDLLALGRTMPAENPQIRPENRNLQCSDAQVAKMQALIAASVLGFCDEYGASLPDKVDENAKEYRKADDAGFLSFLF